MLTLLGEGPIVPPMSSTTLTTKTLPAIGTRVSAIDGPGVLLGDYAGTVVEHIDSRWGGAAVIALDHGGQAHCSGLTEVGIGWHLLPPNRDPKQN